METGGHTNKPSLDRVEDGFLHSHCYVVAQTANNCHKGCKLGANIRRKAPIPNVAFVCSGLRMREASLDWNRPVLGVANFNHYGAFRAVTHLKSASPRFRVPIFVTIFVEQMP
jgi:hypothetical protein